MHLKPEHVDELLSRVLTHLAAAGMRAPTDAESEPHYTASVVQPVVREVLAEIGHDGFVLGGDGAVRAVKSSAFGRAFTPDVAILADRRGLVAVEVKIVRHVDDQLAIATAIGQAAIYGSSSYRRSMAFIVDAVMPQAELPAAGYALGQVSVPLVIRSAQGQWLASAELAT